MSLTPTKKITDHSVGLKNIKDSTERALYELRDEETCTQVNTALCLDILPRYRADNENYSVSLADIFSAVVCLSDKIDGIIPRIENLEKNLPTSPELQNINEEVNHMIRHISALESNLRCLRETLTVEDSVPEIIPKCTPES